MSRTLTDGERDILAELNRDAENGICPTCGEHFTREEWYDVLPDEWLETESGAAVPIQRCCPDCVDGFFTDDTCAHRRCDGSYEPA